MARKPRIHYPGAVYHVMLRGNGGAPIFFEEGDYLYFEELLQEGIQRFHHRVHGYCWMPNHVHLAIEVANTPLSKIVQNLSFRYTRRINKNHQRMGHLFQGRYKAILVDANTYLLELVRYIQLNPVRAAIVAHPEDYRWSGHQAYLGKIACQWLTTDWILQRFGKSRKPARRHYERFILEGMGEGYRKEFHQGNTEGRLLGDESFIESIPFQPEASLQPPLNFVELSQLSHWVCQCFEVSEEQLKEKQRRRDLTKIRVFIALFFTEGGGNLQQVAEYFRRDLSTLSRQLIALEEQIRNDSSLHEKLDDLRQYLNTKIQA